jgi:RimJ/RimL family protein N-acetyltransferase
MSDAFTASVPRLQTRRLTLREYRAADFDRFADHLADPESTPDSALVDRATAWRIFAAQAGLWLLQGAGWWAVEARPSGQVVGNVGAFFRGESTVMEIGFNTYRAFWGQGFATEAAEAVLNHAFEVRGEPKIQALIAPSNAASLKVAQRLGATFEGETDIHGQAIGVYAVSADARDRKSL